MSYKSKNDSTQSLYTYILFYSHHPDKTYACFSNFYDAPVTYKGKKWPTSEHAYQAMKFYGVDDEYMEKIRNAPNPAVAKKMGGQRKMRGDWEKPYNNSLLVKDRIMYEILVNKFHQNPNLKGLLLGTLDCILVEHTQNDKYWADGGINPLGGELDSLSKGGGKNMLGKMLMKTREYIKIHNL